MDTTKIDKCDENHSGSEKRRATQEKSEQKSHNDMPSYIPFFLLC